MNQPVEVPQVQAQEQKGRFNLGRNRLIAVGTTVLALGAGAGVFAYEHSSRAEADVPSVSTAEAGQNCADLSFSSETGSNSSIYNSEAFLPKPGAVENQDDAKKYVTNLFGKEGPLAGKANKRSLATFMSAVVKPAHDGKAVNPNSNYAESYNRSLASYDAEGGLVVAQADCKQAYETAVQVSSYTDKWVSNGSTVTEFTAIRDKDNNIVDMKLTKRVIGQDLKGILLRFNDTTRGLDDFTEVLISTNDGLEGNMYVKGSTVGQGGKPTPNTSEVTVPAKANQQKQNQKNQANGGGQQNGTNQGVGATGGAAGPNGNNPEAGPGGVTNSPGGGGGTTPETTPGTTTPGNTTPNTTTPGTTTPPTTRPPQTTTLPPKDTPSTLPKPPGGY